MPSIEIITAITGGKDIPVEQDYPVTVFIDAYDKFKDPRRNSRIQKLLPHKYSDADITIWIDGNIKLLISPDEIVEKYLKDYDMAIFGHPSRNCIYQEAITCCKLKLDDIETLIEQVKYYEDHGYGKDKGLCEGGIMIRRNNDKVNRFNEAWWADYCRFSRRDQLSLMPALDKVGLNVNIIHEPFKVTDRGWIRDNSFM